MHGELPGLSECLGAALIWALEWLLSSVDVGVFLEVLTKSKFLEADHTYKLLCRLVSGKVSSKGEPCGEFLIAVSVFAFVGSFHFVEWLLMVIVNRY